MTEDSRSKFEAYIRSSEFPCVGAKSALAQGQLTVLDADAIDSAAKDLDIYDALVAFGENLRMDSATLQSFAVLFAGPPGLDERAFEKAMWDRLQCLHNLDVAKGADWNHDVSNNPESPDFSLSIGGSAYFIVGLHRHASRPARRFMLPALVFNSHEQFEKLRIEGRYDKLRSVIRDRDQQLAGTLNPMLDEFGERSEARQYSGRKTEETWECPFEHKETTG